MKLWRNINLFVLIALLFFGSVGINVFAHFCKADGTSFSVVIPVEHECVPPVEEESCCKVETVSCCAAEDQNTKLEEPGCCSEQIWNYKIASDFQTNTVEQQVQIISAILPEKLVLIQTKTPVNNDPLLVYSDPPPPLSGQELLIRYQVFRI